MNKYLRGVLRVFAGMILVLILIVIGIIIVSSITSKKLVYKLPEKR